LHVAKMPLSPGMIARGAGAPFPSPRGTRHCFFVCQITTRQLHPNNSHDISRPNKNATFNICTQTKFCSKPDKSIENKNLPCSSSPTIPSRHRLCASRPVNPYCYGVELLWGNAAVVSRSRVADKVLPAAGWDFIGG
jgi:hypothetical protein